ncbi:MAG: transcriptional repressor LexA [Chloroflexi bacterium]|nr:MAG: transcriptional repressor LexA [Chloroflexota bacterium]
MTDFHERFAQLSERQQRIYHFIRQFQLEHHYPPTIREIGSALDITSTSVVNYNLNKLEEAGLIERDREVSRGLKLVNDTSIYGGDVISIPLMGTIAAGEPIPVLDESTSPYGHEVIQLTRDICKSDRNIYALRVKGDSMIDALINDGDIVVMRREETASNGEMVAVWLKNEESTTLKRFYHEGDRIRLQPANPTIEPIYVDPEDVEIQGKVVAVIRSLN